MILSGARGEAGGEEEAGEEGRRREEEEKRGLTKKGQKAKIYREKEEKNSPGSQKCEN